MEKIDFKNLPDTSTPYTAENFNQLQTNVENAIDGVVNTIYPVGAIYISTNSTSPETLFGVGTWERIEGRFLIGVGTCTDANNDTRTLYEGQTGGTYSHKLTTDEMPPHNHSGLYWNETRLSLNNQADAPGYCFQWLSGALGDEDYLTTGQNGNGIAHNNVPPYLAVYMWKRTA